MEPLARPLCLILAALLAGCAPAATGPASPSAGCAPARSHQAASHHAAPSPDATPPALLPATTRSAARPATTSPDAAPASLLAAPPEGPSATAPLPPAEARWTPLARTEPLSGRLPSGLFNPMPGGLLSGYRADTGLDISGFKMPVHAVAAGTLDYAEAGHTRWTSKNDSPFTIRLKLDQPIAWKDRWITHAYYGHLSALAVEIHEGQRPSRHVEGGQRLGVSGWANRSPHLHLGLLLDGHTSQDTWDFILDEGEVREALGVGGNGQRLPRS